MHRCRRVLPSPSALPFLARAALIEAHDEWQVADKRDPSEAAMTLLTVSTTGRWTPPPNS